MNREIHVLYYSYAGSDKKDAPRLSIAGRLIADLLKTIIGYIGLDTGYPGQDIGNMNRQIYFIQIILITLLISASGLVCDATAQADKQEPIFWMKDATGTLTLEEVQNSTMVARWKKSSIDAINFGFTDSAYWLKIPMVNRTHKETPMLIEIAFPLIDYIDVYLIEKKINCWCLSHRRPPSICFPTGSPPKFSFSPDPETRSGGHSIYTCAKHGLHSGTHQIMGI